MVKNATNDKPGGGEQSNNKTVETKQPATEWFRESETRLSKTVILTTDYPTAASTSDHYLL